MRVALFDFDGTLCPGDSIVPFLRFCVAQGIAPRTQWLRGAAGYLAQRIHLTSVSKAKAMTLSFIAGREQREMDDLARQFIRERILTRCRPEGLREIDSLRTAGVHIAVVSASPDVYMRVLPEFIPIDTVLATPCYVDEQGRYTGRIGVNCRGDEKVRRVLDAWPEKPEITVAYGDSRNDLAMLSIAERAVLVNSGKRLAKAASAECVPWREEERPC